MSRKFNISVFLLLSMFTWHSTRAACPVMPGSISTSDATICSGTSPGTIDATASSGGNGVLFYIWQQSTNNGTTWTVIAGANSEDYTPGNLTTSTWYKRTTVDLGGCATQETGEVKFTVTPTTSITSNPSASEICDGGNASFSVTATGSGLTYQWQEDDGGGYSNITNGGVYSNATTATLNLTGIGTAFSTYSYRCIVGSTACTDGTSSGATLTVLAAPSVTSNPSSTTNCVGDDPTFTVAATGDNLTYKWQEDDGGGFTDIADGGIYSGSTTTTLTLTGITAGMDGYKYRCEVDNSACTSVQSTDATLTVQQAPSITGNPSGQTVCVDGDPTFTVTATGTALTYQWQEDNGGGFSNLANAGVYSGVNTATLTITDATATMNTYDYRCVVDNSSCPSATSASANLEVNTAPNVTVDPVSQTLCVGDDPTFSVVATGSTPSYQWQEDDGGGFSNLSNGGSYSGALTSSLTIANVTAGMDGYDYRCVVSGVCTPNDVSAAATITVQSAPSVTVDPSNDVACVSDNASFSVTATGSSIAYQWQENTGGGFSDITNGGVYGGATTATLSLTGVTAGMNGYDYRCEVTNTACPLDQSTSAELTVETAPAISANPSAQTVCPTDDPTFSVTASGSNLTYQWQEDDGGGYGNITNGGIYSNATTATLTLTNVTSGMDGYLYRCVVSGSCTPSATSTGALLNLRAVPAVTANPTSKTVCVDDDPTFSVTATGDGITYQWQEDDGGGFSDISNGGVYSGATTSTLTLTDVTAAMSTYDYRCVVSGTCSPAATSSTATLTVHESISFSTQPASTNYCTGDNVTLKVTLSGTIGSVQWREDDGGGFANLANNATYSGVTTQTLTLSSLPATFDGYDYQLVATNTGCGSSISNTATLTNTAAPTVTANPTNQTACVDDDPTFSITATGASLTYQWQEDAGSGYSDLSANATYSGVNTATLSITDATAAMTGNDYRCVVSSATCPTATSLSASLTVNTPPAITANPTNQAECENSNTSFSVTATGTALTYQWQEDQGSGFSNLSNGGKYSNVTTSSLDISTVTSAFDGYEYRCVVSGTCTPSQTSTEATLTIVSSVSISSQPSSTTVCADDDPTFSVTASGGTITYQWQEDDGGGFTNLANGGVYAGVTTASLSLTDVTSGMDGYDYRCVVTSTCGGTINSNSATLDVDVAPIVTANPSNQTECVSDGANFSVTAGVGSNLSYQWQEDDGSGFSNITNGGIYSGATTDNLAISAVTSGMDGYDYRCVVGNTGCGTVNSSAASLTVNQAPAITANGGNETICEAGNANFTITATGTGLTYQWQENTGSGYTAISNGGKYSGATSNALTVSNVTTTMDEYIYRCIVSGTCNPSATGNNDTLFVSEQPTVTADPSDATICESTNTSFSVTATGSNLTYQWQVDQGSGYGNISNGGVYSNATTATLSITGAVSGMDGYKYRCEVDNAECSADQSNEATLTVQTTPAVTVDPSDVTVCETSNTSFSVTATGSSLTYQWQVDEGSGYSNISNGGVYSNATTTTLGITGATSGMDGYKYRCEVDNSQCSADQSNEATLTVQIAPAVTTNPDDTVICESNNATFTVAATGTSITFQWQVDEGSGYNNVSNGGVYSNATTATLSITGATSGMDGYKYRCEVDNSQCSADQSNEATLTVQTTPSVTANPSDVTICETNNTNFSVTATGSSLTYQWQEDQGSGYANISNGGVYSNATTATLSITGATSGMDGYKYRCEVDNSRCAADQSNEATLTVQTTPSVTADPSDVTICESTNTSFSVTATGTSLTFQWQVDEGSGYNNVSNGGVYSNATTATLSITGATSGMDGYKYRCEVDNSQCSADQSNEATLTVQTTPSVTANPSDVTICENSNTSFSVTASGSSLTYQWQVDEGSGYGDISNGGVYSNATTATLSITSATTGMDGYKYRCEVDNSQCSADQSNEATLTVQTGPAVTTNPKDSTICESNDASFTIAATGSSLNYQWQVDEGSGYGNISNGGVYSNATTTTLNITGATSGMDGYKYRCEVDNSQCTGVQSNEGTLTVQTNPSITVQPGNTAVCDGANASFSVTATGSSLTYQWQEDQGSGFSNISNGGIYSGATTNSLSLTAVSTGIDGYDYRCIVDNSACASVTTSSGTITVKELPSITSSPSSQTACVGDDPTFSVTATGTALTYQWQVDQGSGYSNLSNGGFYSGVTTSTLSLSNITTGLDGFDYRCEVGGDCTPSQQSSGATLTVQSPPVVTANPSDVSICDGDNTSFSVTATGTALTYQWQEDQGSGYANISNGGVYSNTTTTTLSISGAPATMDGYKYRCEVDNSSCTAVISNEADITILSPPSVTANASDATICETDDATFTITASGDGLSFQWQEDQGSGFSDVSNGGVYSGATTSSLKLTAAPNTMNGYDYRCVVSGTCNPRDTSDTVTVTVDTAPSVTSDPSDAQECEDDDALFQVTATGTSISFQWQEDQGSGFVNLSNGGSYSGVTTTALAVDNVTGSMDGYEYRCVVSGPNCPSDISATAVLDVLLKSTAPAPEATDSSFCEGFDSELSAKGGVAGAGSTIEWYSGPNGTGTNFASGAGPITISPTDTTTYYVRREGTCNTTGDAMIMIAVQPKPTADFNVSSTCEGLATVFRDASSVTQDSISGYSWNLGDASASSKKNVSHLYSSKGVYNVRLIVETKNGCLDTARKTTEIFEQPTANFNVKSVCLGDLSEFEDKSSIGGTATLTYDWSFGDGTGSSNLKNPEYEFLSTGGYTVQLKVTSSEGCVDSVSRSTNIFQLPKADFTFEDECFGDAVDFDNKSSIGSGTMTHEWDFDDLATSTTSSPSHTYAAEGTYDVMLISTSNKGCKDTSIQEVEIFELPTAGFTAIGACEGADVSFTNTSTNPTGSKMTYEWDLDNGSTSNSSNPLVKYNASGSYDVTLTVTTAEGCEDDVTNSIDVYSEPEVSFSANTVCDGFATTFTNASKDPDGVGLSYIWRFGDGDTSLRTSPAHVYPAAGTYNVTLVVLTGNGCEDSSTVPVNVWPKPKASYRVSNVCEIDSASFINTSSVASGTFTTLWKFGDLTTSTLEDVRHKYAADGTYDTKVIITSDRGCQDSVGSKLIIHPMPEPNFTFNNQCDGDDVNFVNTTVVTTGTQYAWDLGNGNSTTSENPVYRYLVPGSYNVTLTATTANGCKETSPAKQVVIHPRVRLRFSADDECDNDTVNFSNGSFLSAGTVTYEWKFGDGSPSVISNNANHLYDTFGVYTATLVASTDQGCIDSAQQDIEIFATPIAQYDVVSNCENEFTTFTNNTVIPAGYGISYQWDFDNGFTSNLKSPKHQYTGIGNYITELIAVTTDGCSDTSSKEHNIWPVPEAEFKMFGNTPTEVSELCLLETVNFAELSTIATGKIIDWTWNFGDGSSKTGKTVQKDDYLLAGVYVVTLTVESDSGCLGTTSQKIEILPKPNVSFNVKDTCEGGPIAFYNKSTVDKGQMSFIWDFGDNVKSTLRDPLHTYASDGVYNVVLYGVSTDGCLDTAGPTAVTIHALPEVNIASNTNRFQFCEGDSIVLSVPLDSLHTYTWTAVDTTIDTIGSAHQLTVRKGGTYGINVVSTQGCIDDSREVLTMWERPTANAGDDVTISKGYTTQLNGSGGVLFTWSPDTTFVDNSLIPNPVVSPPEDQEFTLVVADENGCLDTAFVQVTVDQDYKLVPSDVFTPNGDGVNDVWVIENISTYPDCQVIIANRWQQVIYTSNNYGNDWDGTVDGKELPPGGYSYLIKCGDSKFYTGTVSILR